MAPIVYRISSIRSALRIWLQSSCIDVTMVAKKDSQIGHCDAFIPAPNYLTSLFNSPSLKLEPTALTPLIYTDSIRCFLAPYFQTRTYDSDKDEQPSSFQHIRSGSIVYTRVDDISSLYVISDQAPRLSKALSKNARIPIRDRHSNN